MGVTTAVEMSPVEARLALGLIAEGAGRLPSMTENAAVRFVDIQMTATATTLTVDTGGGNQEDYSWSNDGIFVGGKGYHDEGQGNENSGPYSVTRRDAESSLQAVVQSLTTVPVGGEFNNLRTPTVIEE